MITYLDHISHCKTASGTNKSDRWTYPVIIINTHRNQIARHSSLEVAGGDLSVDVVVEAVGQRALEGDSKVNTRTNQLTC